MRHARNGGAIIAICAAVVLGIAAVSVTTEPLVASFKTAALAHGRVVYVAILTVISASTLPLLVLIRTLARRHGPSWWILALAPALWAASLLNVEPAFFSTTVMFVAWLGAFAESSADPPSRRWRVGSIATYVLVWIGIGVCAFYWW